MTSNFAASSTIDPRWKGFPPAFGGLSIGEAVAQKKGVLSGDFLMPVAVLRQAAIDQNIRSMQAFATAAGVELCPHGKTSMSPELFARQLAAGAWGMTAATAHHVRLYRQWGVERILLANQLVAPADIALVLDAWRNRISNSSVSWIRTKESSGWPRRFAKNGCRGR